MQKGELVYSKGYGYADLAKEIPVDPAKTMFRIGSVSKTVTAAALARLYDQGKLDLDAPIQTYVPSWPDKAHDITLRQLAGHIAGIRHYQGLEFMSQTKYKTVSEGLEIFEEDPLINEPGTEYSYSSYGWNLIAAAMEAAAQDEDGNATDFLALVEQEVFVPIGMNHTVADHADEDIPNRTSFYQMRGGEPIEAPYVDNSYKWAGGGFIGTTEDLCKFGQAHMTSGYLSQETLDLWMESQHTKDGKATNYGIGWRTFTRDSGYTFYGHSGGSVGGITFFMIHIPSQTTLAITANVDPLNYGGIQFELMELFIQ
jgi:serine beta-lactamase-like protein LACTB